MDRCRPATLTLAALSTCLFLGVFVVPATPQERGSTRAPNLDEEVPTRLQLEVRGQRIYLGFRSAVRNTGAGPFEIEGVRTNGIMRADQLLARQGDGPRRLSGVGQLFYEHRSWHLHEFLRYDLRPEGSAPRAIRESYDDQICLRDGYDADSSVRLPGEPQRPAYTGECGHNMPSLRTLTQGISVGYAAASGKGELEVTTLNSGRYWLVHRVDPRGRVTETTKSDNAASTLLEVRWRRGDNGARRISIQGVRSCADSARCNGSGGRRSRVHLTAYLAAE